MKVVNYAGLFVGIVTMIYTFMRIASIICEVAPESLCSILLLLIVACIGEIGIGLHLVALICNRK